MGIRNLKIPRLYSSKLQVATLIQLHTFYDASEESFSSAIYLQIKDESEVDVVLETCKEGVHPLHEFTLPKLELLAAVLGVTRKGNRRRL